MKEYHDTQDQSQFFKVSGLVNVRLHTGYQVPAIHSQLSLAGPFRFIDRIGLLAYKLELPDSTRVHNIVPVAPLESANRPSTRPVSIPSSSPAGCHNQWREWGPNRKTRTQEAHAARPRLVHNIPYKMERLRNPA